MTTYTKLEPDFKTQWIQALRSGNYNQATHRLRVDNDGISSYCCLGVACELLDPNDWRERDDEYEKNHDINGFDWDGVNGTENDGFPFVNGATSLKLTVMNDNGASFDEIAEWIENNL